jgi:hypothetical protein
VHDLRAIWSFGSGTLPVNKLQSKFKSVFIQIEKARMWKVFVDVDGVCHTINADVKSFELLNANYHVISLFTHMNSFKGLCKAINL